MTQVLDFPDDWYRFASAKFKLRSRSQSSQSPWTVSKNVYGPHTQLWCAEIKIIPAEDPLRQQMSGFVSRLEGQAGLLRFYDITRIQPWYNRNAATSIELFGDGTGFTDGTGFSSGLLPPLAHVGEAAERGSPNVVIAGLLESITGALTPGDLIQIKPNGIAGTAPNLYEVVRGGATNADGEIGVEIRPRLRSAVASGDQVSLYKAASVFRLVDDDDAEFDIEPPVRGTMSFRLIEALDQVV